jgi:glycerol uptake facilitator-like aquaporin
MNKYLVEFLGTMFIVFIIFATGHGLAIGAAVAISVLVGKIFNPNISFNPVVSISLYSAGKLTKSDLMLYIIVEILGGLSAFYVYKKFVPTPMNI